MEEVMGNILLFAGDTPPEGWAICDGRLLRIVEYSNLFTVLGTFYGGDGKNTFALPDFRGRAPMGAGPYYRVIGDKGGAQYYTLLNNEFPVKTIITQVDQEVNSDSNKVEVLSYYYPREPFETMQPYLGLHYIICIAGIVPSPW